MRVIGPLSALALLVACAHAPPVSYRFETGAEGWEMAGHSELPGVRARRYAHPVHEERLEVFEVSRPAPANDSAAFAALAANARTLPSLGEEATAPPRALGDDELSGARGYWVAQRARAEGRQVGAATFVVPGARRHFVVRLSTGADDVEQARAWLRDLLLRDFRFPQ